jgi:hypothetical protein
MVVAIGIMFARSLVSIEKSSWMCACGRTVVSEVLAFEHDYSVGMPMLMFRATSEQVQG